MSFNAVRSTDGTGSGADDISPVRRLPAGEPGYLFPPRRWLHWGLSALAVVAAVCLVGTTTLQGAFADAFGGSAEEAAITESLVPALPSGFEPYIVRQNGRRADPVNLVFTSGDANEVAAAVQRVLGWQPVHASPMAFVDQGRVRPTAWQLGLPTAGGSRTHLRIATVSPEDGQGHVLAAVHRDDTVACGHVGAAFDEMRDYVASAFEAAGYRVHVAWLGNTEAGSHCDGSWTTGDGKVAIIDLTAK